MISAEGIETAAEAIIELLQTYGKPASIGAIIGALREDFYENDIRAALWAYEGTKYRLIMNSGGPDDLKWELISPA